MQAAKVLALVLVVLVGMAGHAGAAQSSRSTSAEFLYELAREYRRSGHLEEAAHELQKLLLIEPDHPRAVRELGEIRALIRERRERAISQAMAEAEYRLIRRASQRAIDQVVAEQQRRQLARLLAESGTPPLLRPMEEPPVPSPPSAPRWPSEHAPPLVERPAPAGTVGLPEIAPTPSCTTFTFDASSSSDPDHDRLSYRWEFGDGTTAQDVVVQHTYVAAGEYRVVLEVCDDSGEGCGRAQTGQVVRVNTPPTAVLESPALACAGAAVRFSAAQSSDSPGEALTYRWAFGDGTTAEGAEVTHTYPRGGNFPVQLVVDDGRGTSCSTDLTETTVRVNSPPTAKTDQSLAVCAAAPYLPLSVIFSGIGSRDPELDPLTYRWTFGDGGWDEGVWVSHTYARGGRYTATLTVDDGTGTACASAIASVPVHVNYSPQAVVGSDVTGCPGDTIAFDAGRSSDPDGDALTYRWDFGDGTAGEGAAAPHRYAAPGQFPVTVTVDDASGLDCGAVTATLLADINAPPVPHIVVHGEQPAR